VTDAGTAVSPIVVTGVGIISALGRNSEEFWSNLVSGGHAVLPATGGVLAGVPGAHVGRVQDAWLPEAPEDRNTALALTALSEAWEQAGLGPGSVPSDRAGIVLGKCQASPFGRNGSCQSFYETCDNLAAHLGLAGPRVVISTACAAGANAIGTGMDLLRSGSADVVAAGGVDVLLRETFAGFARLRAISPAATAPYSRSDGLSLGEGAAFLILETAERARQRGVLPLVEVAGYGLSADAYHATSPDPSGRGALLAVRRAIMRAGVKADEVSYVNGHGTGTPANDQMERRVMRALFGDAAARTPLSSTKSAIGHTLGAAGAIEAAVCALAVTRGVLPPTVNVDAPVPDGLDIVPNAGRPARIDVAISNSYGFGGNNCSVVLARVRPRSAPPAPTARRVAICGLGAVGGCGLGIAQWRSALLAGRSLVRRLGGFGGELNGCAFGVEPHPLGGRPLAPARLWRHMDTHARQALAAVASGWEDAGWSAHRSGRDDIGLVFATGYGPVRTASRVAAAEAGPDPFDFSNSVLNAAAGAVCQAMNMRGPTTTVASGGVSAIIALDIAVALIQAGQAERMVVVAADDLCELVLREHAGRERLASDGVIRPYSMQPSGTALGAAAVALMVEAADALARRGGTAYAEVAAVGHLGRLPSDDGADVLERVLRRVLKQGGCEPDDVGYCAGFGSGTDADIDELRALHAVFPSTLLLSAPKSITGECEAASGGVSLLAAALAVAEGAIVPTANLGRLALDNAVRHVTEPISGAAVRRALANAASPGSAYGSALLATVG
jgi:3-oxoacyl-[acyl-carrier-protein] synthase II